MPKLTIGYSTLAERVKNIRLPLEKYEFLVLVQNPGKREYDAEKLKKRALVAEVSGKGVTKSRNRAIELTKTDYLIFGDDDVEFHPEKLNEAIAIMEADPQLTLLLLAATDDKGRSRKQYPKKRERLTKLNSARAATYEMLIRAPEVRRLRVKFDENFGAGAENYLGDEFIFIADLIDKGAKCEFAPIYVASHPEESSGSRWGSDRDRQVRARIFTRVFGIWAPLVRLAFGLRRRAELGGTKNVLKFVLGR